MQRSESELGEDTAGDDQADPQESRKRALQQCILNLEHACQCRDANCGQAICPKIKLKVSHAKTCKGRRDASCEICKPLVLLIRLHSKLCQHAECPVPFCFIMRQQRMVQKGEGQASPDSMMAEVFELCLRMEDVKVSNPVAEETPTDTSNLERQLRRIHYQVLKQRLMSLRHLDFAQQKQQVLYILQSNPQLRAAFIAKRRAAACAKWKE